MIGLITSMPELADSASWVEDQSSHSSSSVRTSRMTLLSTRVSLTSAPGQLHDFFSGDSARATPLHMFDQGATAIALARRSGPLDPDGIPIQFEFDLRIRQKTELPSYRERNCDLAFAGDSQVLLLLVRVLPGH